MAIDTTDRSSSGPRAGSGERASERDPGRLARPLPRGRHSIPAELVVADQRRRVLAAVAHILAEQGYAALTVQRVQDAAGISRKTFYELFENKRQAALAAYEVAFQRFRASLSRAGLAGLDPDRRVRAAIAATLGFAAEEPELAQLLSGFALCAEPALARRVFDYHDRLALLLCGLDADATPDVHAHALIGALTAILTRGLIAGESLLDLEPELVELALRDLDPCRPTARARGSR